MTAAVQAAAGRLSGWWHWLVADHDARAGRLADGGRVEAWASVELRNVNRLVVGLHWWDADDLAVDVSWGQKYSDPVWSFGLGLHLPRPVSDWLGRHRVGS